jgi:hypothetical protein
MADFFLIGILVSPIILAAVLRVNANYLFLSGALGYLLSNFVGKNESLRSVFVNNLHLSGSANNNLQLALILLPVVITMVAMIGTVHKRGLLINLVSSLAVGVLLAVLIVPLLPSSLNIMTSNLWNQLKNIQDIVVAAGSAYVLVRILISRPKHGHPKHSHNK